MAARGEQRPGPGPGACETAEAGECGRARCRPARLPPSPAPDLPTPPRLRTEGRRGRARGGEGGAALTARGARGRPGGGLGGGSGWGRG